MKASFQQKFSTNLGKSLLATLTRYFPPKEFDESLIDITSACIEIYDPVCGCNGITYPNSCYATTFNGVKSFTKGACD